MLRLLVVEDQMDFYENYLLRMFEASLPMDQISVTHVPTLQSALVALLEPWDVILVDYTVGPKTEFLGDTVRSGVDLVVFRRAVEALQEQPAAYIVGTSSSYIANELLVEKGADVGCLKLDVPAMAREIETRMKLL